MKQTAFTAESFEERPGMLGGLPYIVAHHKYLSRNRASV